MAKTNNAADADKPTANIIAGISERQVVSAAVGAAAAARSAGDRPAACDLEDVVDAALDRANSSALKVTQPIR